LEAIGPLGTRSSQCPSKVESLREVRIQGIIWRHSVVTSYKAEGNLPDIWDNISFPRALCITLMDGGTVMTGLDFPQDKRDTSQILTKVHKDIMYFL
jgi:hypothetical protein